MENLDLCKDNIVETEVCIAVKKIGQCEKYPALFAKWCPKSCDLCNSNITPMKQFDNIITSIIFQENYKIIGLTLNKKLNKIEFQLFTAR